MNNFQDSYINTSSVLNINYTQITNGDLTKVIKLFTVNKMNTEEQFIAKNLFRFMAFCGGIYEEFDLFIRLQMSNDSYPNTFYQTNYSNLITLFYDKTDSGYDVYLRLDKQYTIVDLQHLYGETDYITYNFVGDFITAPTTLTKITTGNTSDVGLITPSDLVDTVQANVIDRNNNFIEIRYQVTLKNNIASGDLIGTIPTKYLPYRYRDCMIVCEGHVGYATITNDDGTIKVWGVPKKDDNTIIKTKEITLNACYIVKN